MDALLSADEGLDLGPALDTPKTAHPGELVRVDDDDGSKVRIRLE